MEEVAEGGLPGAPSPPTMTPAEMDDNPTGILRLVLDMLIGVLGREILAGEKFDPEESPTELTDSFLFRDSSLFDAALGGRGLVKEGEEEVVVVEVVVEGW